MLSLNNINDTQRHAQTLLNERQQKVINKLFDLGPGGFTGGLTTRKREISNLLNKIY